MTKVDVFQNMNDTILAHMESGTMPWRKGWTGDSRGLPTRANGEGFTGGNVIWLLMMASARGFTSDLWMTYKQAESAGAKVRKGAKAVPVLRPVIVKGIDEATGEQYTRVVDFSYYNVFNANEIDGLPMAEETQSRPEHARIAELETYFNAIPARIEYGGNRACYFPQLDKINMPHLNQFHSADEFYGTLAHELIHWTGAESRLDRKLSMKREEYAFEELVAELGAVYSCGLNGGKPDIGNSAAYLNSWIAALKNDRKFFWDAARLAMQAVTFLSDFSAGKQAIAA